MEYIAATNAISISTIIKYEDKASIKNISRKKNIVVECEAVMGNIAAIARAAAPIRLIYSMPLLFFTRKQSAAVISGIRSNKPIIFIPLG